MKNIYKRHRFPPSVIQYAVWLYYRFNLSVRDVEDVLAERNISVSYEAFRLWVNKFRPKVARRLKRRHPGYGDTYFLDEVFVKINGKQHYLWRAIDQDGEVVDVYLQERRDARTAKRFFRCFLRAGDTPRESVTDKLRSYGVAHRSLMLGSRHNIDQYAHNRAELSHQPTRVREHGMRRSSPWRMLSVFWEAIPPSTACSIFTDIRFLCDCLKVGELDLSKPGIRLRRLSALMNAGGLLG